MKKKYYYLSFFFVLGFTTLFAQNKVTISGKVKNAKQDTIKVIWYGNFEDTHTYQAIVNKKGDFSLSFPFEDFKVVELRFAGKEDYQLFVKANDVIEISYDRKKPVETFNIKSQRQDEVEIHKSLNKIFPYGPPSITLSEKDDEKKYKYKLDSAYSVYEKLYTKEKKDKKISQEFDIYFTTNLKYRRAKALIDFPFVYEYFFKNKLQNISDDYYDFLDNTVNNTDSLLSVSSYMYFSDALLQNAVKSVSKYQKNNKTNYETNVKIADILFTGKLKEYHLAKVITNSLQYSSWKEAEKNYFQYMQQNSQNSHNELVKKTYIEKKRFAAGQTAFNFSLKDANGKLISLQDFKGKIVYLDVWASWCAPCIIEMKSAKELKNKVTELGLDNEIVFLYVSLDESKENWLAAIKKHEIKGVHLSCQKGFTKIESYMEDEFSKQYGVKGIPSYYLIDREGKFTESNSPRPSSPKTIELIKKLVKK